LLNCPYVGSLLIYCIAAKTFSGFMNIAFICVSALLSMDTFKIERKVEQKMAKNY
jgi:hypothetical protein